MSRNSFNKYGFNKFILEKLDKRNITIPTEIQEATIPKILNEEDVIGQSKTGTGKTLAYILPLLNILHKRDFSILIIAPTNELSRQIYNEIMYYSENLSIKTVSLSGQEDIDKQIFSLKDDYNILVGVPGRIIKLVETGNLKLGTIKKIVIDEADFMIDLGFYNDLIKIFDLTKNINQIMIFSATLSAKTKKVLDIVHNQKITARVETKNILPENIENYFFPVVDETREENLLKIMTSINPYSCIIFARTKDISNYLFNKLKSNKYSISCLNGDLKPSVRKRTINAFREGKFQYLVATDLASRGLDFESITHVINYNLPVNEIDYLHRAGRTGRMHDKGIVYSLCNELDEGYLKKYASNMNFELKPVKIINNEIVIDHKYKGVKPRFNLNDLKRRNIKQSSKTNNKKGIKYGQKKKRS